MVGFLRAWSVTVKPRGGKVPTVLSHLGGSTLPAKAMMLACIGLVTVSVSVIIHK